MHTRVIGSLVLVGALVSPSARGQDRYVDIVNGDDSSGDGSAEHPWRTISWTLRQGEVTRLHVRPGIYEATAGEQFPINLRPNLDVLGTDAQTTTVRGRFREVFLLELPSAPVQCRITGLTITQERAGDGVGIAIYSQDQPINVEISNCVVANNESGVSIHSQYQPVNVEISNCVVENNRWGISISGPSGAPLIHDCVVRNNRDFGVGVAASQSTPEVCGAVLRPRIERNIVEENGGIGIYLGSACGAFEGELYEPTASLQPMVANNIVVANRIGLRILAGWATFVDAEFYAGHMGGRLDSNWVAFNDQEGLVIGTESLGRLDTTVSNSVFQSNRIGIRVIVDECCWPGTVIRPFLVNNTVAANSEVGVRASTRPENVGEIVNSIVSGNGDDLQGLPAERVHFSLVGDGEHSGVNGNLSGDPGLVDPSAGDFHVRPDSPCIDAGSMHVPARAFPGLDFDGKPRDFDGDRDGARRPDLGAFEFAPDGLACRYGNVDAGEAFPEDVLFVDGSAGDIDRIVRPMAQRPLHIDLLSPPRGPRRAPFVLLASQGAPTDGTTSAQPRYVGTMCFRTPLTGSGPEVLTVFNNVPGSAARSIFGDGAARSSPAPFAFTVRADRVRTGRRITLQGFIANWASRTGTVAITNAVVIVVP